VTFADSQLVRQFIREQGRQLALVLDGNLNSP
jgi:hypothetical protein